MKTIIHHIPCPITGKPYSKEIVEEQADKERLQRALRKLKAQQQQQRQDATIQDLRKELGLK